MTNLAKERVGRDKLVRPNLGWGYHEPGECFHIQRSVESLQEIWKIHTAEKKVRIRTIIDPALPSIVPFNALKLQHCLNNLVDHAFARTTNGRIFITITKICCHNREYIALSVQDSGNGITDAEMKTLFTPCVKTKAQAESTYGVVDTGLAIAKTLMHDMGGRIVVKSDHKRGSIFSLVLPLPDNFLANIPDVIKLSEPQNPFRKLNVLIVDDYNLNQLTIKALLQDTVSKTYIASHGYQAIEVLSTCSIDIILMDIHMPIMDGIETTMRIRASHCSWADVKIIALTADPYYQHTHLCEKIGMNAALAKPVNRRELLATFEMVMRSERAALAS